MRVSRSGLAFLLTLLSPALCHAQNAILQGGPWQPGHVGSYGISNSQPVVIDAGPAQGSGYGVSELALIARGVGTPPYVGQGTGPYGSIHCLYDAPITNPSGYHFLCLSPNATGTAGLISFGAGGGAATIPFNFNINGTSIVPVACSGSPSSSFAAVNGFVTHC